jgi:hypothetical protein
MKTCIVCYRRRCWRGEDCDQQSVSVWQRRKGQPVNMLHWLPRCREIISVPLSSSAAGGLKKVDALSNSWGLGLTKLLHTLPHPSAHLYLQNNLLWLGGGGRFCMHCCYMTGFCKSQGVSLSAVWLKWERNYLNTRVQLSRVYKYRWGVNVRYCPCSNLGTYIGIYVPPTVVRPVLRIRYVCFVGGTRGSVLGWRTMLQAGRSRVRVPMRSLDFFQFT